MKEEYYLIKEAAAKVGVETHVLRYWEEELKMDILRNDMGHRYYSKKDIDVLSKVRQLKEKGLQLKAIRNYLEMRKQQIGQETKKELVSQNENMLVPASKNELSKEEKLEQFQQIMNRIVANAIQENNEMIGKSAGEHAANAMMTQMSSMTKEQEAKAEERFQRLDRTLREVQQARMEAAASYIRPVDKRRQKRLKKKLKSNESVENITLDEKGQGQKMAVSECSEEQ